MLSLLQKIEANAVARLVLPEGTLPSQELARFRQFLKMEQHRLKILHRGGASGRVVCQARSTVADVLIRHLWTGAVNTLSQQARKEFPSISLVALGGYGRGELNPYSDLDIMFLHVGQVVAGGTPLPCLAQTMNGILYPLWDLGCKVGHSVRTISECVEVANRDMQAKTSLLEARLVIGDTDLFNRLQKTVAAKCVEGREDAYIQARLADQAARHAKFGNSATMQEPNIKNGCGGLRDFQNLHWMALVKYGTRGLSDMEARGLISASERKQLEAAYDFLLRVRDELHYQSGRAVDVLARGMQPAIAHHLGYHDRSPARRLERLMRDLYAYARNIYLNTRLLEERLALLPQAKPLDTLKNLIKAPFRTTPPSQAVDGFLIGPEQMQQVNPRVFKEQPRRLMRVFLQAQQRGLKLHPDLTQLLRRELALVNHEYLRDEHVRETFLAILNHRGNVARVLRKMHEVGLLGKYLPEFGRLTCLVQHEFYHQYAADEHTLVCLEQLDAIGGATQPPLKKYGEIFQAVERPFILYLALLLHDAGKAARSGKHSQVGAGIAMRVARRLAMDADATNSLRLMVEHHLAMAMISQRRDLDDLGVVRGFATQIQTPENLRMLTLLTLADSRATSSSLWTEFKDALLWELYSKTLRLLTGGPDFVRAEERHRDDLQKEVQQILPRNVSSEELAAHFASLPSRYFQVHQAREVLLDVNLTHRFMAQQMAIEDKALVPVTAWIPERDRGYTRMKICTWDRAGLFYKIAGSMAAAGLNILSAQAFTRTDGIILDTFIVTDARTGNLPPREQREQAESFMKQVLTGHVFDFTALIARLATSRPAYQSLDGERLATRIHFDNETSDTHTVIDLETEDRVGLLYRVGQVFAEVDLDIFLAKVSTEKGAAIDSFYVCQSDGEKLNAARQRQIEARLREVLATEG